jgi:hypothetical protein
MGSLFSRDPGAQKQPLGPYSAERLEPEIAHLRKRKPVRSARETSQTLGVWVSLLLVVALLALFFMDPPLHGWNRGSAIRAYLYLHGSGSEESTRALAACGILTANEVDFLSRRSGQFQDYFSTPTEAEETARAIVRYMKGVSDLHAGHYDRLDLLNKIRFQLFVRWGLEPPTEWDFLDPSVNS